MRKKTATTASDNGAAPGERELGPVTAMGPRAKRRRLHQLIDAMGGIERFHQDDGEYQRRWDLMDSRFPSLLEKHPGKWAALTEGDELLVADSLDAVFAQIDARGKPRGSSVVRSLDPDPKRWLH